MIREQTPSGAEAPPEEGAPTSRQYAVPTLASAIEHHPLLPLQTSRLPVNSSRRSGVGAGPVPAPAVSPAKLRSRLDGYATGFGHGTPESRLRSPSRRPSSLRPSALPRPRGWS